MAGDPNLLPDSGLIGPEHSMTSLLPERESADQGQLLSHWLAGKTVQSHGRYAGRRGPSIAALPCRLPTTTLSVKPLTQRD